MTDLTFPPHQTGDGPKPHRLGSRPPCRAASPPAGLGLVVRVDVDARRAEVLVGGALTAVNCDRLLRVCARAGRLATALAVTVDLSGTGYISPEALDRLDRYPWTVVGHGDPVCAEIPV